MNSDFSDLLQCLNSCQAEYLVVGGYAIIAYAEPRFTKDLDVWVRPTTENAERVYRALEEFGAPLSGLTVQDLATPGLVYQIGVPPVRVDILMSIDGVDFDVGLARANVDKLRRSIRLGYRTRSAHQEQACHGTPARLARRGECSLH